MQIFNISTIFNEFCLLILSWLTFAFSEVNDDKSLSNVSNLQLYFGFIFLGVIGFVIVINLIYLIPLKMIEIFMMIVRIIQKWRNDPKIAPKPNNSNSQSYIFI